MVQQLPRRERERLARRQEIIDAARAVFARKGFNDTTLDDVAERAEFGKGTLYNYFPNKDALFASVLEESFDGMWIIAQGAMELDGDFVEKMEAFITGELQFFFTNPASMHLMMREAHHLRGSNPLMQWLPKLLRLLSDTIAAEQERGTVIEHAQPVELATILLNMLLGQFTSRFYQRLCLGMSDANGQAPFSEPNISDLFAGMTPEEIAEQVAATSKLITTVYFRGITR